MPKKVQPGKALVRLNRQKDQRKKVPYDKSDTDDWCKLPVKSITHETSLDDFFHTANLSNSDFAAQKLDVKLLSKAEIVGIISPTEKQRRTGLIEQHKHELSVFKRPRFEEGVTTNEIHIAEQKAYLAWRRELGKLEQIDGIVFTPYERNLDFWRQLWQVIEKSDILVQLVDARQPLLYFSKSLNDYIKEVGNYKKTLILVNKSDLLTGEQRAVWSHYFESIGLKALFFSALYSKTAYSTEEKPLVVDGETTSDFCDEFNDSLISDSNSDASTICNDAEGDEDIVVHLSDKDFEKENHPQQNDTRNYVELLTVDELIDVLLAVGSTKPDCAYLTVGFLGYPNVGKSSTLNSLCGTKKVSVSATPGRTKHYQTIFLQPDLQLCDCPGMVMPSFVNTREDLVVAGILSIDEMRDCIPPVRIICEQIPRSVLSAIYGISIPLPKEHEDLSRPPTPHELLGAYALVRGFMTSSGNPHYDRAARIILKDYVKGRLRYCHPPPGMEPSVYQLLGLSTDLPGDVPANLCAFISKSDFYKLHACHISTEKSYNDGILSSPNPTNELLTDFDKLTFSQTSFRSTGELVRSSKKLPQIHQNNWLGQEDLASTASWSTVGSAQTVGGSSLLSGMSISSSGVSLTGKKPWRKMSAVKHEREIMPNGKKKAIKREKLRRLYSNLDQHSFE